MKIAIYPYTHNNSNDYIKRVVEGIQIGCTNALISSLPQIKHIYNLWNYDYVWLNWFEDLPRKNRFKVFVKKILTLILLVILRVRIVVTLHNRRPHEWENTFFERILFFLTFKLSYRIIILCDESKKILLEKFDSGILKKTILVPHPTYNCKPKHNNSNSEKFKVLFFGHLRPYKNIELIFDIAGANPEVSFTIAGKPMCKEYEKLLKELASKYPNLDLNCQYLSEDEIASLIDTHSILLLPYNLESSLNSGVIVYALCKSINVIAPAIGTIKQLSNCNDVFSYTYETKEEHFSQLQQTLHEAIFEYTHDYQHFNERIKRLHEEIIKTQSPEAIAPILQKVFT